MIRKTSEAVRKEQIYKLVNKRNTCLHYQKTEEEKEQLKLAKALHKAAIKGLGKKVLNPPTPMLYEISRKN